MSTGIRQGPFLVNLGEVIDARYVTLGRVRLAGDPAPIPRG
jgi:hypothetical protein